MYIHIIEKFTTQYIADFISKNIKSNDYKAINFK